MKFTSLPLSGAYLIDLEKHEDERGFFTRFFCVNEFAEQGLVTNWVQMNTSLSCQQGTLRGLHFQIPPKAEVKVVRCLRGAIWDVIVDLRNGSDTFGQWHGAELNDDNRTMLYVPKGLAHGFETLQADTEMLYMHSEFYSPQHEGGVLWNDPDLQIDWPQQPVELSEHDKSLPRLTNLEAITL